MGAIADAARFDEVDREIFATCLRNSEQACIHVSSENLITDATTGALECGWEWSRFVGNEASADSTCPIETEIFGDVSSSKWPGKPLHRQTSCFEGWLPTA